MSERPRSRRRRRVTERVPPEVTVTPPAEAAPEEPATTPQEPQAAPKPRPTGAHLGSYGNASIDQWDQAFIEAGEQHGVDPRLLKAMMDVESGGNGDLPLDRCRSDGSCGPMQVKPGIWGHVTSVPEQIAQAAKILGDGVASGQYATPRDALFGIYFPTNDVLNSTTRASYGARVDALMRAMGPYVAGGADTGTPAVDPWRPYPYPKMVDLIVEKPYEGAGFDRVAFRGDRIRGFATHITAGEGSLEFYRDFFSTGGERARDALADLGIDRAGRIGLFNDWRDPNRGGTRAGWANGGTDGLEGPGIAFYRMFPDINSVLVSGEHIARVGQLWSDAQIAASIEIRTAIAQELNCPWESYPVHPAWRVWIELQHRHFATKSDPDEPYISTLEPIILREVQQKLRTHQTGSASGDPLPAAPAAAPAWQGAFDLPAAFWANEFGTLRRHNEDGTVDDLHFDPTGPISLAWMRRCAEARVFPEAEELRTWDSNLAPGKERWASFANGWRLWLPLADSNAAWVWLDRVTPPATVQAP